MSVPRAQAEYLGLLGRKAGWGLTPGDVAKFLVLREVARLQEAEFHSRDFS